MSNKYHMDYLIRHRKTLQLYIINYKMMVRLILYFLYFGDKLLYLIILNDNLFTLVVENNKINLLHNNYYNNNVIRYSIQ